ncbi:DUF7544 domain-containing protein [Haladaptatus sp. CMSO5]|uniref:DUF7544 domain-containing protein n=1 Tax=Haladaptatus sp. CMSO5 TaxID=3120514 RepID=UPI002FCE676C
MSWYAIEDIEDALTATRQFLFPFDMRKWLKLAIIVFFIGGVGGGGGGTNFTVPSGDTPSDFPPIQEPANVVVLILVVVAVLLLIGLLFAIASSVFQFVFVDAVRSEEVHIRAPFRRWFGKGVRLFVFSFLLFLLILAPIFGVGAVFLFAVTPLLLLFLLPFLFIVAILLAITLSLTTDFVVPVMMHENLGVLAGWRRFWPVLREQWKQYGVYVVLRWLLGIAGGILVAIALAVVFVPVLGIGALLGFGLFAGAGGVTNAVIAFLVVLAIPIGLLLLIYALFVQVPVATFFRYYALFVLGDSAPEFDLIPDQRRTVRADGEGDPTELSEDAAEDTDEPTDDDR